MLLVFKGNCSEQLDVAALSGVRWHVYFCDWVLMPFLKYWILLIVWSLWDDFNHNVKACLQPIFFLNHVIQSITRKQHTELGKNVGWILICPSGFGYWIFQIFGLLQSGLKIEDKLCGLIIHWCTIRLEMYRSVYTRLTHALLLKV